MTVLHSPHPVEPWGEGGVEVEEAKLLQPAHLLLPPDLGQGDEVLAPEASRARRHPPLQAQYGLPQTPNVIDTLAPRDAGGERPGPEGGHGGVAIPGGHPVGTDPPGRPPHLPLEVNLSLTNSPPPIVADNLFAWVRIFTVFLWHKKLCNICWKFVRLKGVVYNC